MTGKELQNRLANNIKTLRKNKFTQEELAEKSGLSWQMITNIEGCRRWPSQETLAKLANALNVDIEQFFAMDILATKENQSLHDRIKLSVINELQEKLENLKK